MGDLSKIDFADGRAETRRAVQEQLGDLQAVLDRPDVIEVVINRQEKFGSRHDRVGRRFPTQI